MSGNKNLKNKQEVTELIGKIIELSLKLIVGRKNYKIVWDYINYLNNVFKRKWDY